MGWTATVVEEHDGWATSHATPRATGQHQRADEEQANELRNRSCSYTSDRTASWTTIVEEAHDGHATSHTSITVGYNEPSASWLCDGLRQALSSYNEQHELYGHVERSLRTVQGRGVDWVVIECETRRGAR
jgi:hypothetical protein